MIKKSDISLLPRITFNLAIYNEEKRLPRCLNSIRKQNYPQKKIEIVLMDGGSTDKTKQIAKKYKAKLFYNEKRLPEPGFAKGYKIASGDYVVFMAADNVLYDNFWLKKIIQPFLDYPDNVFASFSKVVNDKKDNIWSQYLNEDTDPFNAFVYGNCSNPDKFSKEYKIKIKNKNYIIYDFNPDNYPLIALAQGTTIKKDLQRTDDTIYDDIAPLIDIIKRGKDIAYVKNTGIRHYSLKGFSDFCRKFNKRIYNSMKTGSYYTREQFNSTKRKLRKYLFLIFTLSLLPLLAETLYLLIKKRKKYLLLHPLACLTICYYIILNFIKVNIKKNNY